VEAARVEREQSKRNIDVNEDEELIADSPVAAAARAQQLTTIKELLTATELGTS
jgi:hypothetical protein